MPRTESVFAGPANTGCLPRARKHWVSSEPSCVCLHTVNTDFCVYADLRLPRAATFRTLRRNVSSAVRFGNGDATFQGFAGLSEPFEARSGPRNQEPHVSTFRAFLWPNVSREIHVSGSTFRNPRSRRNVSPYVANRNEAQMATHSQLRRDISARPQTGYGLSVCVPYRCSCNK